ncbi:PRD domain-containing protein [Holdemania massiliensis]|uniref:PRD domain-containing protein n=1 Tax=Holdemania massiliensis TaxID=1468449 RepID=UPI002675AB3E|nr:PRD domain-containing protein [Holdemania massiliensis]
MKVIKNINNNVAVCLDSTGAQVVAFGKGIGFGKPPYELSISKIQRTFYDIDPIYLKMIQNISPEMIELSAQIIDFARSKVSYLMNSSIVFTLADHLAFAVIRHKKNMHIEMPIYYDVKSLYEEEYEIGEYALKLIKQKFNITLSKEEITGIALHFINAAAMRKNKEEKKESFNVIKQIKGLIEEHFHIQISEDDFNYSRFVSHLQYLLKRGEQGTSITSENYKLYTSLKTNFPDVYECALKINEHLHTVFGFTFNEEELLYLMLHINRLCVREDCYR